MNVPRNVESLKLLKVLLIVVTTTFLEVLKKLFFNLIMTINFYLEYMLDVSEIIFSKDLPI